MVSAVGSYVQGKQTAFPHGERLVSGPFETLAEAVTEQRRLEAAGLYPDALLSTTTRRQAKLPTVTPRTAALQPLPDTGYDLRKRPERERAAADLAERARAWGAVVHVENWDGEPDVNVSTPSLQANIWLAWTPQAPMPIISWYGAAYPLRAVPGAWSAEYVNDAHRRKASSVPTTWAELFDALETGVAAAIDGSAFVLEETA